ncbi:lysozyme inhibitor LprI family protein [Mangrovibacter yixingensis]|uniref:lysozyme inhibitor LprI family protein n=1 Tax=Mangrovibacter yixingensis TaxID=1529639 RepID=UPI001CFB11E5|nr:lysozyme inhibitor LprI family protein [Mangrovibacter yixingensis]
MKRFIIVLTSLLAPLVAHAELSTGTERDTCFKKNTDISSDYNCLSAKREASSKKLDELIAETVKRIKANNIGPFNGKEGSSETAGDVYSHRFLDAQKKWKEYRDELCLSVATELDEDSDDYQSYIDQCVINLNKNHTNEIIQMNLPPVN